MSRPQIRWIRPQLDARHICAVAALPPDRVLRTDFRRPALGCPNDRIYYTPSGRPYCNWYGLTHAQRLAVIIVPPICFALLCLAIFWVFARVNMVRRRLVACEARTIAAEAALATLEGQCRSDRDLYYRAGWDCHRERRRPYCEYISGKRLPYY